jgi:hypothetical protein
MIVSVARSLINTCTILFVNDVITKKISEEQKIKWLKVMTVSSVVIALSFIYLFSSILNITFFFSEYYFAIVMVPLIGGLFIKETKRELFWISASAGFLTFSALHLAYSNLNHEIFLISIIASLSIYLATVFVLKKMEIRNSTFSFSKLCDEVIAKNSIQASHLGWVILLFFLLPMFFRDVLNENGNTTMIIEGITGLLGFILFFVDKLHIKHKNTIIMGILWYCFAFSPIYVFLNQKLVSLFTINFIVSIVLLAGLFRWNVFLSFLLSGSSVAVISFGLFNHGFQESIASLMYLFLFLGYMAMIAYIAFRNKEPRTKESHIHNKIIQTINTSIAAENKYKNVLLKEDKTTLVSFKDLRENILAYFQKVSLEKKAKLIVTNSQHKVLNTGLPLGFFYKTLYSLILNVFYCNGTEEIRVKFCCDISGNIQTIEIIHGQYKINDRAKYFRGSYPKDILEWDVIKLLFKQLEIRVTEGIKTLKVIFPSKAPLTENNVISFETLRARVTAQKTLA